MSNDANTTSINFEELSALLKANEHYYKLPSFGALVRRSRKAKRLSQKKFAMMYGISESEALALENGYVFTEDLDKYISNIENFLEIDHEEVVRLLKYENTTPYKISNPGKQ